MTQYHPQFHVVSVKTKHQFGIMLQQDGLGGYALGAILDPSAQAEIMLRDRNIIIQNSLLFSDNMKFDPFEHVEISFHRAPANLQEIAVLAESVDPNGSVHPIFVNGIPVANFIVALVPEEGFLKLSPVVYTMEEYMRENPDTLTPEQSMFLGGQHGVA